MDTSGKTFWKRRFGINSDQVNMINWSIFKRAQNGTSQQQRIWCTKHMSHTGPTGVNLHHRKDRKTEACPHCNQREDNIHVLQCTIKRRQMILPYKHGRSGRMDDKTMPSIP